MRNRELVIDSFAGGGGASLGITLAIGRCPDIAVNHDAKAIRMHAANHPKTKHFTEDVFKLRPREVTKGRRVGLLWASPDCKHFSRAKGGQPVEKRVRGLAWVVVKWATEVRPRIIILENVREFEDWGPLLPRWDCPACTWKGTEGQAKLCRGGKRACPRCDSRKLAEAVCEKSGRPHMVPDPSRKGITFRQFVGRLKAQGYAVDHKVLNAADFGAPTHRRRLFLVARCDGLPVVWPEPTHGDPKKIAAAATDLFPDERLPWRTAAECIDWSIPCPSIFDRKKPLKPNTLRRIALGVKRYVLENPRPFIVTYYGANKPSNEFRGNDVNEPLRTVVTENRYGIVSPLVVPLTHAGERRVNPATEPLPTVTGANRGEQAVVTPFVARIGQTNGNGKYTNGVGEPLTTVTTKAEHMVVAPYLVPRYGEKSEKQPPRSHSIEAPMPTVVPTGNGGMLVAPVLDRQFGKSNGAAADEPLGTVMPGGHGKTALVSAFLAKHFGGVVGVPVDTPLPTTTTRGTQNQLVAANLIHLNHGEKQWSGIDEPNRTVTTGNHAALVYSFLVKYFGTAIGCPVDHPLPTVTAKDRCGLVTVTIDGEPFVIVDIGMRMLTPRELARAQGFGDDYVLTGTKTNQVERIGNSVSPNVAEAMVRANYAPTFAEAVA